MSSSGVKRARDQVDPRSSASSHYRNGYGQDLEEGGLPYGDLADTGSEQNKKQKSWRDEHLNDSPGRKSHGSRYDRDRERSHRSRDRDSDRDREPRRDSRSRYDSGSYKPGYDRRDDRDRGRYDRSDRRDDRYGGGSDRDRERGSSRRREDEGSSRQDKSVDPRNSGPSAIPGYNRTDSSASLAQSSNPVPVPQDISKPAPPPPEVAEPEPEQEEQITEKSLEEQLEERRRKRREILEKFSGVQSGVSSIGTGVSTAGNLSNTGLQTSTARLGIESARPTPPPVADIQGDFDLAKSASDQPGQTNAGDVLPAETTAKQVDGEEQISAADYNPDEDRKVDDEREQALLKAHNKQKEVASGVGEPGPDIVRVEDEESEYEEVEVDAEEDEDFDMFALDEPPKKKVIRRKKQKKTKVPVNPVPAAIASMDNYDDAEGYYRITPGEIMDNGMYKITVNLGKGMFAQVIRATVLKTTGEGAGEKEGQEVAIKVIRSQESMYVAGKKEAQILQKLGAADLDDKKHIVRLLRTFEHRGHLCLVFENLSMNLRDVVKRFGKDVGLNLRAVRAYAHQMFLALSLTKKCNIIHGDLKPDNILVTENKAMLKVCDLGSACDISEADITPYLVSRFYRAPEIILGLKYDESIDMWSIGCTLYELYTGKILFPGRSNNQMLHLMMDLKGKINHKMIKKAQFGEMHFDESMNFISVEKDKITGQDVIKTLVINKAARELKSRLIPSSNVLLKMKEEDAKLLTNFVDLLEKALMLDPAKRMSARDALLHPFLTSP